MEEDILGRILGMAAKGNSGAGGWHVGYISRTEIANYRNEDVTGSEL